MATKRKRQTCDTCLDEDIHSSQIKKFDTCTTKPCNRTCNSCWTRYLKITKIEDPFANLECHVCHGELDMNELLDKGLFGENDKAHFLYRKRQTQMRQNRERECLLAQCNSIQKHDADSRIFACEKCGIEDCTAWGHQEHHGRTCYQFQDDLKTFMDTKFDWTIGTSKTEVLNLSTTEYFDHMYHFKQLVGRIRPCPECGMKIELAKKCARLRCGRCNMEFCMKCEATYLGQNSVPELGNAAHDKSCSYSKRTVEDKRAIGSAAHKRLKAETKAMEEEATIDD